MTQQTQIYFQYVLKMSGIGLQNVLMNMIYYIRTVDNNPKAHPYVKAHPQTSENINFIFLELYFNSLMIM